MQWNTINWDSCHIQGSQLLRCSRSSSRKCSQYHPCWNAWMFCRRNLVFPESKVISNLLVSLKSEPLPLTRKMSPCPHHHFQVGGSRKEHCIWVNPGHANPVLSLVGNFWHWVYQQQSSLKHTVCAQHTLCIISSIIITAQPNSRGRAVASYLYRRRNEQWWDNPEW